MPLFWKRWYPSTLWFLWGFSSPSPTTIFHVTVSHDIGEMYFLFLAITCTDFSFLLSRLCELNCQEGNVKSKSILSQTNLCFTLFGTYPAFLALEGPVGQRASLVPNEAGKQQLFENHTLKQKLLDYFMFPHRKTIHIKWQYQHDWLAEILMTSLI